MAAQGRFLFFSGSKTGSIIKRTPLSMVVFHSGAERLETAVKINKCSLAIDVVSSSFGP